MARPLCGGREHMNARNKFLLRGKPRFWLNWSWDGPLLLFVDHDLWSNVLLLKGQCCPFSVHSAQEHMLWRDTSRLAKGSWPCLGKSDSYSAPVPAPVQVEESRGRRTDLAQLMLTSPSPRGALASSCHCWWWWGHAGYQPGSFEDCLEPIKALMKCGCLDGRWLWRAWALVTRHSSLAQSCSDSSVSTGSRIRNYFFPRV